MLRSLLTHRSALTTFLEVCGLGLIVYGVSRISLTAGFLAGGVALVLIGALEG